MAAVADPTDTRRDVSGTPAYVYGVARRAPQITRAGIAAAEVSAVEHAGLVAIVSPIASLDVRATRRDLLAHQEVLQEVFGHGPVVPLRFGTVFDGAAAVVSELLAPRRDALLRLLARFENVAELSVRAHYVEDAALREIVRDDPRVARLRDSGADVALGEAVVAALRAKRTAEATRFERKLVRLAEDAVIEEPRTEYELFRGAFLVEQERIAAFDSAMDELARARNGCVVFKYVGPLPPHSFVDAEAIEAQMGIFTGILLLPLAPLRGTIWLAEQLAAVAEEELNDERAVRRLLVEAELALDAGELTPEEHERVEDELLERLEAARAAHPEAAE